MTYEKVLEIAIAAGVAHCSNVPRRRPGFFIERRGKHFVVMLTENGQVVDRETYAFTRKSRAKK